MSHTLTPAILMPDWAERFEAQTLGKVFSTDEEKLTLAIQLAVENVKHQTGGPFGAAVFNRETHQLIAIGINSVVPAHQSWAHAEMTAYARAQHRLQTHNLKGCVLATSCEPCAMCYGATPWSGVEQLLYAATKADAERAGFDEGDKGEDWVAALQKRNIEVRGPLLSDLAQAPFTLYSQNAGQMY